VPWVSSAFAEALSPLEPSGSASFRHSLGDIVVAGRSEVLRSGHDRRVVRGEQTPFSPQGPPWPRRHSGQQLGGR
jgi:hypothetical protein